MRFPGCKNALKYVCGWGFTPDPAGRAYSAPQTLAGLKEAYFEGGGEGKGAVSPNEKFTTTPLPALRHQRWLTCL